MSRPTSSALEHFREHSDNDHSAGRALSQEAWDNMPKLQARAVNAEPASLNFNTADIYKSTPPGDNTSSRSGGGAGGGNGETAQAGQIMDMLVKQYGLSPAGAAGIVGNMTQENQLSTAKNSGGIGLCQWIGERADNLQRYAAQHNESPTSVQAQVGFLMQELQDYPGLLNELKTTNNPRQAALDFSNQFERPGAPMNAKRQNYAQEALTEYA